jgi:hypothetical protein
VDLDLLVLVTWGGGLVARVCVCGRCGVRRCR